MPREPSFWLRSKRKVVSDDEVVDTQPPSDDETDVDPAAIVWTVPVRSVEELFRHRTLSPRLTSGLVFVQNKRPMADLLVRLGSEVLPPSVRFRHFRESEGGLDDLVEGLCLKRPSRAVSLLTVTVLECDLVPTHIPAAVTRLANAAGLRGGVWVRGHLRDLHPSQLRLFDTAFLFDMSNNDADTVRSSITLPEDRLRLVRDGIEGELSYSPTSGFWPPEPVLVFTAGVDRMTGARMSQISQNPAVLPLREDGPIVKTASASIRNPRL